MFMYLIPATYTKILYMSGHGQEWRNSMEAHIPGAAHYGTAIVRIVQAEAGKAQVEVGIVFRGGL